MTFLCDIMVVSKKAQREYPKRVVPFYMPMLISCGRCGRVHKKNKCIKAKLKKAENEKSKFYSSSAWQQARKSIRERDNHLCQLCKRNLFNTIRTYTYDGLSVHHITPISEDAETRLDPENLITLCEYHHKLSEDGQVDREILFSIAKEQTHPPA